MPCRLPGLVCAFFHALVEKCRQINDRCASRTTTESHQLKRFRSQSPFNTLAAKPQHRMLDERQQRYRITGIKHRFDHQTHQRCSLDIAQMTTTGIIGIDTKTGKLADHATRQITIRRYQCRSLVFIADGITQRECYCQRFLALIGGFDQINLVCGLSKFFGLHIRVATELAPRVGGLSRTQRLAHHALQHALLRRHILDMLDILAQNANGLQQLMKTVLRMPECGGVIIRSPQQVPRTFIEIAVQTGQHNCTIG